MESEVTAGTGAGLKAAKTAAKKVMEDTAAILIVVIREGLLDQ
jgi:hypothetical protein